jgi:hypothetical protein
MNRQESWQLPIFDESKRRMPFDREAVVGVEGVSTLAWLQAADVVVGQHRTRRQASQWIASVHRRYPRCLLAVARQRHGRWCILGLPARNILMRGGVFNTEAAEQFGRMMYRMWAER